MAERPLQHNRSGSGTAGNENRSAADKKQNREQPRKMGETIEFAGTIIPDKRRKVNAHSWMRRMGSAIRSVSLWRFGSKFGIFRQSARMSAGKLRKPLTFVGKGDKITGMKSISFFVRDAKAMHRMCNLSIGFPVYIGDGYFTEPGGV